MTWMMNHESIHIVMGDNSNRVNRRFRELFFGKVLPTSEDPLTMLYSSLASPRHYSTRWFHEGIATFMETWMAGAWVAPWAVTTRWRSGPWCATTLIYMMSSDSNRKAVRSIFKPERTRICMARVS